MEWIALRQWIGTAGVLFFIWDRMGKIKKKRATRLSSNAVHDKKLIS
mgnify:CR=1